MISQEEAWEKIAASVRPLPPRRVPLGEALDCFAAEDLWARLSLPSFDNSAMDGYAVVAKGCEKGTRLKVIGEQPAGAGRNLAVARGEAIRIFTGAPLPAGADAVIMQEDVMADGEEIGLETDVEAGDFVRRRGGDVAEGQQVLVRGDRITPQRIALLAAQGWSTVEVGGQAQVALISTGDELCAPDCELGPGQIYDSNSALLSALVRKCGARVASATHCRDSAKETAATVQAGAACDAIIITGGVSVGARDFVKDAIGAAGGALDLWRVAVKPGKPFLFGRVGECAVFGLPGNPVSAFVTFLLFVRPALLQLMGANETALGLRAASARLEVAISNESDRPHYFRGYVAEGVFRPQGRQESHALFGLSRSNALLLVRAGETLPADVTATILLCD